MTCIIVVALLVLWLLTPLKRQERRGGTVSFIRWSKGRDL
jgi:hypothetical protein